MLIGMNEKTVKPLIAGALVVLVVLAVVLGNMARGDDKPKAETGAPQTSITLQPAPSTDLTAATPTPTPEPTAKPPNPLEGDAEDINAAAITKAATPIARSFLTNYFTYDHRNFNVIERIKPLTTRLLFVSLSDDLIPDDPSVKEAIAAKQDSRPTITGFDYDSWDENGVVMVTFQTTVTIDHRVNGGNWAKAFDAAYAVTVSKTRFGWRVSQLAIQ